MTPVRRLANFPQPRFQIPEGTPRRVMGVRNRPRSNGCLGLSTGRSSELGSTRRTDEHCPTRTPRGGVGTRYA